MKARLFILPWAAQKSPASSEILINPLAEYLDLQVEVWAGAGQLPDQNKPEKRSAPMIFLQVVPPADVISDQTLNVVWIPMWDQARAYTQKWWNNLPKTLRIVAFSDEVHKRATSAGLRSLPIKFFKNPAQSPIVNWSKERTLFYWNRRGSFSSTFIRRLCWELKISRLLLQDHPDPGIYGNLQLPQSFHNTIVERLPDSLPREDYLLKTSQAQIYLAPRASEGVGLSFIEAMARGSVVFAFDAPTMNEYIISGTTGVLLRGQSGLQKLGAIFNTRVMGRKPEATEVSDSQDWLNIRKLNLEQISKNTRLAHELGFKAWNQSVPRLADFLTKRDTQ